MVDPQAYINKMNVMQNQQRQAKEMAQIAVPKETAGEEQTQPEEPKVAIPRVNTILTQQGLLTEEQNMMLENPTPFNGYENEGLSYSSSLFRDDTVESIVSFLRKMRLTKNVCYKFAEIYIIAASQDVVLTWSNSWLLQRRAMMFALEMSEFKNTLLGPDADSLLFGDFDLVIEMLKTRLEARNGRSFEGFERKAGVSNYQYSHNFEGTNNEQTNRDKRAGLSKLGNFNPFTRR